MSKVLTNTTLPAQLRELTTTDFDISESRGAPVLEQTKKNTVRRELLAGLRTLLEEQLGDAANVYAVKEGIAVEVESDAVRKKLESGNGMISFIIDIKFKNLEYDAYNDADDYVAECEIKAAKAAAASAAKKKPTKPQNTEE